MLLRIFYQTIRNPFKQKRIYESQNRGYGKLRGAGHLSVLCHDILNVAVQIVHQLQKQFVPLVQERVPIKVYKFKYSQTKKYDK